MFISISKQIAIIVIAFDLLGTLAFAISGAILGKRKKYNYWGVLTLAFCTAAGGGTLRNVMVNLKPPVFQQDGWMYVICVVLAATLVYYGFELFKFKDQKTQVLANRFLARADAVGLAVFVMLGAKTAMMVGLPFFGLISFSVITAAGGGIIRDVIAGEKPYAFRGVHYITWCVLGGTLAALLDFERLLLVKYVHSLVYKGLFALLPTLVIIILRFIEINKEFPVTPASDNLE